MSQRIVSLLPGATEICAALGLTDRLVGVSHECDYPAEVRGKPVLTRARVDAHAAAADIDRAVRALVSSGLSVYEVDEPRLAELAPDLIITQDACAVCAVPFAQVEEATRRLLGRDVRVLSLSPTSLDDVLADVMRVGEATGETLRAQLFVEEARGKLAALAARTGARAARRTLALEWMDPPMVAGHWTPELLRAAGADPVLSHEKGPTRARPWEEIGASAADVLLLIPCGFGIAQTRRDLAALLARPEVAKLPAVQEGAVWIADGNAYFNRPGPRLVESAFVAAAAVHPELGVAAPAGALERAS